MAFVADRKALSLIDAERGWELTAQRNMFAVNFKLTHSSGAHVVFTGKNILPPNPEVFPREDGFATEWEITATGHLPSDTVDLSREHQRLLRREAMSGFGFFWGEGAGPALLHFR